MARPGGRWSERCGLGLGSLLEVGTPRLRVWSLIHHELLSPGFGQLCTGSWGLRPVSLRGGSVSRGPIGVTTHISDTRLVIRRLLMTRCFAGVPGPSSPGSLRGPGSSPSGRRPSPLLRVPLSPPPPAKDGDTEHHRQVVAVSQAQRDVGPSDHIPWARTLATLCCDPGMGRRRRCW